MPCVSPIPAHRPVSLSGRSRLVLGPSVRRFESDRVDAVLAGAELLLPCGSCVCCQIARAREWAIRCSLEQQLHPVTSFVTLTYADKYCPPTLSRSDLSLFFRYVRRKVGKLRFFACGEYGERRHRPHYHALLFGSADEEAVTRSWSKGFVRVDPVTPARISYVAGYCAKKLGFRAERAERVDYETGELYVFQPPFLQMSRNPGIGGDFRKHWRSWRSSAIWQGRQFPVPRYLHASWRESAGDSAQADLEREKLESRGVVTFRELLASEAIAQSRVNLRSERSQL